jgi:hypothetical protein
MLVGGDGGVFQSGAVEVPVVVFDELRNRTFVSHDFSLALV